MLNLLNEKIFLFVSGLSGQSPWLDGFMLFVTKFFVQALIVLIFCYLVFLAFKARFDNKLFLKKLGDIFIFLLCLSFVWAITELIKGLVSHPRPSQFFSDMKTLLVLGPNDSFPSLHTSFSFALAYFVFSLSKQSGLILFCFAILIGFSRIYVGVHFLLDVLGGAFVGFLTTFLILKIFKQNT